MSSLEYSRGSIWYCNLPGFERSSVQSGYRPVVIVSSLIGCLSSDIVTVCPFTTRIKDISVNVTVKPFNGVETQVLTNQLVTVPKYALSKPQGCLDEIDLHKVETGILVSLGLAKPVVSNIQATQNALAEAKKDREELERLLPQAKEILGSLSDLVKKIDGSNLKVATTKKGSARVKRSPEAIQAFMKEWEDPSNDRNEVADVFGFSGYQSAYSFYYNRKKKGDYVKEQE